MQLLTSTMSAAASVGLAATLGTIAAVLAVVVGAVLIYNGVMGTAWKVTEGASQRLGELDKVFQDTGVSMGETAALGGPVNDLFQNTEKNVSTLATALGKIPFIGGAVSATFKAIWDALKNSNLGLVIQGTLKLYDALKKLFDEAARNEALQEVDAVTKNLSIRMGEASKSADVLRDQLARVPEGAQWGLEVPIGKTVTALNASAKAAGDQARAFRVAAEEQRKLGNDELASKLIKNAEALELTASKAREEAVALKASAAAHGIAAKGAKEHADSLEDVAAALEQVEARNNFGNLQAEAEALKQVAAGHMTAAEAAAAAGAAAELSLTNEIAFIDAKLAAMGEVDRNSEAYLKLSITRATKEVSLQQMIVERIAARAEEERKLTQIRVDGERAVNELIAGAPKRSLEDATQVGNILLGYSKALNDLEQSRFNLQTSRNRYAIEAAEKEGASAATIEALKRQGEAIEREALIATKACSARKPSRMQSSG
jgi:hypothetical protein